jgi:hypothetical protein
MIQVMTRESGRSMTGPGTVWNGRREARLRPEHAHHYPEHFEFRGGEGRVVADGDGRPRREDR